MQHHKTLMQLVRDDWEEKRQIDDAAEERLP